MVFALFLAIQTSAVQTYLGHKASEYLSKKLNTVVKIGSIDIDFVKNINLKNIYIEDLHKDTLLYAGEMEVKISEFNFLKQRVHISQIEASNTNIEYKKYLQDEDFNIQFILDAFDSDDTTKTKSGSKWDISCDAFKLKKSSFIYKNEHDTVNTTGFNHVDIGVKNINGDFSKFRIDEDTVYVTIDKLLAREKSGFSFNHLSSNVKITPVKVQMNDLKIKTNYSNIETNLSFIFKHFKDFNRFVHKVKLEGEFNKSQVSFNDIAYFAPELKGINEKVLLSGKVSGKIDDLRGKNMDITALKNTRFKGDFAFTGLPHFEETLIHFNVTKLSTTYDDLSRIQVPPFDTKKYLQLPANIAKLGQMQFAGTFTGLYNDFYAYGKFSSALGNLFSDMAVHEDNNSKKIIYKGKLNSQAFDFGYFFGVKELGIATATLDVDGSGLSKEDVAVNLKGKIAELYFNQYSYKNMDVEGDIAKRIFKGRLAVADENIDLDFNGGVDFSGAQPSLDFIATIEKADLAALHFIKSDKKTNLSTQVYINVTGDNIDNLVGKIHFDNTVYRENSDTYKMDVFNLTARNTGQEKSLKLVSDAVDAEIKGKFKILDLPESAKFLMQKYLPAYISSKLIANKLPEQNFSYNVLFKKTQAATKLFVPELTISYQTELAGIFNSATNEFTMKGKSDKWSYTNLSFNNWAIDATAISTGLICFSSTKKLSLTDSLWFNDVNLITNTNKDSLHLSMQWDNKSVKQNNGDIKAFIKFAANDNIRLQFLPSAFTLSDSTWVIDSNNYVNIDSSRIYINNLLLKHDNQIIAATGSISNNKNESLKFNLQNFNLSNLNVFTKPYDIELRGKIGGTTTVSDVYKNIVLLSETNFDKFFINNNELGNGTIKSVWDKSKEGIQLDGKFTLGIVPNILFAGYYYPERKSNNLDFDVNLEALQMNIFEPFVKKYCSSFKGFFAGKMHVAGSTKKPLLNGKIDVNAKKITVDYLNTTYKFSHAITIENNSFGVENLELLDIYNNKAVANGKVYHENFKNFQLDFDILTNKFMCLNTTEKENELFYGKAFTSGYINIFGYTDNIEISANVKTEKLTSADKNDKLTLLSNTEHTRFFIPLSGTSEVGENDFIRFIKKDTVSTADAGYKVNLDGLTLDFAVEVTPDAELQLIFDQKVGDIIKAKGKGNVRLKIDSRGKFDMFGDYMIDDGDYLFTLQNVINKKFDIDNGSTIKWTGAPDNAEVNIKAIYKARASLSPFFPADETIVDKKRQPVDLTLLMTENLSSPVINFDIQLPPSIDARVKQEVMGYLSNEAELNRQVFSLMILNSFVTPYQLSSGGGGGANALTAAESNSTELLSNQLSNMLSKISNDFDIGVNYRPGDEITKDELAVALSTQLFNDRLTIDGNVGTNPDQAQSANNIVGDVSIDYKISDDGKFRVKAFNKANDNNQINAYGGYTQGVGVFYREDFDTIGELFKRYLNTVSGNKKKS